jgi:hypothetical protein
MGDVEIENNYILLTAGVFSSIQFNKMLNIEAKVTHGTARMLFTYGRVVFATNLIMEMNSLLFF